MYIVKRLTVLYFMGASAVSATCGGGRSIRASATTTPGPHTLGAIEIMSLHEKCDLGSALRSHNCLPAMEEWIRRIRNVNKVDDKFGRSALVEAAGQGSVAIVDLLIRNGADVNQLTGMGNSALTHAAALGHLDVVNLLIANGANVDNQTFTERFRPLHAAAHRGRLDIIQVLLNAGAAASAELADGRTASDIAREEVERAIRFRNESQEREQIVQVLQDAEDATKSDPILK